MAHYIEARFDESDNTFVPPLRTLGFNQNLTMNDSLLVQSYIECYDVSYPEALRRIEGEVDELRQHLQAEGHYELNDIGTLSLNAEGNMEFHPCEAGILTPALYGLDTFEMQPWAKDEEPKAVVAAAEIPVEEEAAVASPHDDTDEQQQSEERDHAIVIKMSWLRHAVAVAAAIVAFFMIGTPVSNSSFDAQPGVQQSSFIPIASSASAEKEVLNDAENRHDTPTVTDVTPLGEGVAEATTPETAEGDVAAPSTEEFCIVLASQVSQKNADSFMALLTEKGFNEAYVMEAKFRRVVYGHYATKDDATEQLRQLRRQNGKLFGEGWVMKSSK